MGRQRKRDLASSTDALRSPASSSSINSNTSSAGVAWQPKVEGKLILQPVFQQGNGSPLRDPERIEVHPRREITRLVAFVLATRVQDVPDANRTIGSGRRHDHSDA
jgi:hypothetical protein